MICLAITIGLYLSKEKSALPSAFRHLPSQGENVPFSFVKNKFKKLFPFKGKCR